MDDETQQQSTQPAYIQTTTEVHVERSYTHTAHGDDTSPPAPTIDNSSPAYTVRQTETTTTTSYSRQHDDTVDTPAATPGDCSPDVAYLKSLGGMLKIIEAVSTDAAILLDKKAQLTQRERATAHCEQM